MVSLRALGHLNRHADLSLEEKLIAEGKRSWALASWIFRPTEQRRLRLRQSLAAQAEQRMISVARVRPPYAGRQLHSTR